MTKRAYWLFFILILIFGFVIRILPVLTNNFHFTMDQGDDAVHVREILERGQILLVGPETNVPGIFSGPLWYYFLAVGYRLFDGHPMSAVVLLIVFNLVVSAIVIQQFSKHFSPSVGLFMGGSLQIFWWFYDTSRYGFNPFPLAGLSILTMLLLCSMWGKVRRQGYSIAVLVGLGLNSEIAGGLALAIFVCLVFFFLAFRRKLSWQKMAVAWVIIGVFLTPKLIYQVQHDFVTFYKLGQDVFSTSGVYSEFNFIRLSEHYIDALVNATAPEMPFLAALIWTIVIITLVKHTGNQFVWRFAILSATFVLVSFISFGTNNGWRSWHTVAVPPLLFISVIGLTFTVQKRLRYVLLGTIIVLQTVFFWKQYAHFWNVTEDQSLLVNELGAVDWVYRQAQSEGFYVYNYLPSVRDYPYQYLFWWHGRKKYGYVPCEYGRFPGTASFYVPGYQFYQRPQKPCAKLRFLIIEPDDNKTILEQWYEGVTEKTKLVTKSSIGKIRVEKRELVD